MDPIVIIPSSPCGPECEDAERRRAVNALECGSVLYFPDLCFPLKESEGSFLTPAAADGRSKNISYDPGADRVAGSSFEGSELSALRGMMVRFADWARDLLCALAPEYTAHLEQARTSFRPAEISGRPSSPKKDDTRLHVDAFPSRPNHGRRILRVFCNINPHSETRRWNVGQPFEAVSRRFLPRVSRPVPGLSEILYRLAITKARRTPYDHIMLQLHDLQKLDDDYQRHSPRTAVEFAARSTWIAYTDVVCHAALRGQHALEQTFHLDVEAMVEPERSPLRILERLIGRPLVADGRPDGSARRCNPVGLRPSERPMRLESPDDRAQHNPRTPLWAPDG